MQSDTFINGVNQYRVEVRENFDVEKSSMLTHRLEDDYTVMEYTDFPPGSVFALRSVAGVLSDTVRQSLSEWWLELAGT